MPDSFGTDFQLIIIRTHPYGCTDLVQAMFTIGHPRYKEAGADGTASISTLADCGVKRVSMAVLLYKAGYNKIEAIAREILDTQSFQGLFV